MSIERTPEDIERFRRDIERISRTARRIEVPNSWGVRHGQIKDCCYACGTKKNLQQQLCGFWFCFNHIEEATMIGAAYWQQLYRAIFAERFNG